MNQGEKPFELTQDQPQQSSVPPTFTPTKINQSQTGFNLSNLETEATKPASIGRQGFSVGAVIAIFAAVFGIQLLISVAIVGFLSSLNIQFDDENSSSSSKIFEYRTSTCQVDEFNPKAKDPLQSFGNTLGSCDHDYYTALLNASSSFSKGDYSKEDNYSDLALKEAKTPFQKGVAYYWRGHYFNDVRNFKAAEFELSASLQTFPQFAPTLSLYNAVLNNQRRYQEGLMHGKNCLAFNTEYPYCHLNYGVSLLQTGKKTDGLAEIDIAYKLAPQDKSVKTFYDWAHQNFK